MNGPLTSFKNDHFSQLLDTWATRIGYILNVGGCVTPATWVKHLKKSTGLFGEGKTVVLPHEMGDEEKNQRSLFNGGGRSSRNWKPRYEYRTKLGMTKLVLRGSWGCHHCKTDRAPP